MNKLTKLYLIVLALTILPMDAMAKKGWFMTESGEDETLYVSKIKKTVSNNNKRIAEITKRMEEGEFQGGRGIKGEKGDNGDRGDKGLSGGRGDRGVKGEPGDRGYQGAKGAKGDKGDTGLRGSDGDSFYTDNYGNLNMLSVIAVGNAVSNMPAPTSNGFFTSAGFSGLGGENASAIGLHYTDDTVSYKVTYGRSGHEQSVGLGIGFQL